MNRTFFVKATAVATLSIAASAGAASAQINLLNVGGQAVISAPAPNAPNLFIDFLSGAAFPPTLVGNGVPGNVFAGTSFGVFASVAPGTQGVIQDLNITAASIATNPAAAPSFMTIGGYTFTLGALSTATNGDINFGPIRLLGGPTGTTADLFVQGTVTGGSLPAGSTYQGIITAQFAGQTPAQVFNTINNTPGGTLAVTYSANFVANVVPEPSTYALLATGIGALAMVARRRRQQA